MEKINKILVVDDDDLFRESVIQTLKSSKEIRFTVYGAKVGEEALEIINNNKDIKCILLDYNFEKWGGLGQMNGLEIAEEIKKIASQIPIIMTSEVGDRGDLAMKAAKSFIHDFLDKPFSREILFKKLSILFKPEEEENKLSDYIKARQKLNDAGFITKSDRMLKFCFDCIIASKNDWNVMIIGETGVGKTFLSKIIHDLSGRKNKKYIEVNCASFVPTLIESELFGHIKGSYTDAKSDKKGIFEEVEDGTLLLDEISEIPSEIQAKLLYTIGEQKTFFKVGNPTNPLYNKARIIASTNFDIRTAIDEKKIREDLLGRFGQILRVPPLRDRPEDIPPIIKNILKHYNLYSDTNFDVEKEAVNLLMGQPWIKNIRQLKDVINKTIATISYKNRTKILLTDIEDELVDIYGFNIRKEEFSLKYLLKKMSVTMLDNIEKIKAEAKEEQVYGMKALTNLLEKEIITEALNRSEGNILSASRILGENKDTFRYHIKSLGL